jgi:NitT/TauT family transport system substrate-binding protein
MPNTTLVFDSSRIPGEIIDLMVVNSRTLTANPKFGKALVGAWYETLQVMFGTDAHAGAALAQMARASGTDVPGFKSQLATTKMFVTPSEAYAFTTAPSLLKTMDLVRTFSFAHGLLGKGAKSADVVGIAFPGGKALGDAQNTRMRFDPSYTKLALEGKL